MAFRAPSTYSQDTPNLTRSWRSPNSDTKNYARIGRPSLRNTLLWISGVLASGIFGSLIGSQLEPVNGGVAGALGGAAAFVCARLWAMSYHHS